MSIGVWEPLWLNGHSRCLYAALHRPGTVAASRRGVVFMPPLFHEQPRSRRFLAEVASGFAQLGLPCLRFDFYGTGDSNGGGDLDFASMRADLGMAIAALSAKTHVDRITLLAWRGSALPVWSWLRDRLAVDQIVFWEPIVDGASWLSELERADADERSQRPRPRPGLRLTNTAGDGQLMGFAVSPNLRADLTRARLEGLPQMQQVPIWAVVRNGTQLPIRIAHRLPLPANAPHFEGGASMEAAFFMSPQVAQFVDDLGRSLIGY